ncbi:TPA: hypothetical protein N0F65_002105 [Lagenidium giganteum]|uniref:Calpain catalytic domain-containing protein n=1 Tax=Lagenidium giganteum TaxID=4803 RepID=A0AAV2ZBI2_9STRA|nr:TPA: hypothetical protein N0F65_002105 [Lagenidium giganteum]
MAAPPPPSPRRPSVEQRYAEAFAAAEDGKRFQNGDDQERDYVRAIESFELAIRLLSRLAIVESVAKRVLVQDAVNELKDRVAKIEATTEYLLARAMKEHTQARELEAENARAPAPDGLQRCIDQYLAVGDWYMKAYAAFPAEDVPTRKVIEDQVEYVIAHVSKLKQQQATTAHGASVENGSDMTLPAPPVSVPVASAGAAATAPPSASTARKSMLCKQESSAAYSPEELDVLRRSSLINGHLFVPWLDDLDTQERFQLPALFVDPDGLLPLSRKQKKKMACWKRPSEYAKICRRAPVMIANINPQVVKQDIVTDCSFVASVCIAAAYEQRFRKPLITNIIYPTDPATGKPVYNPCGKYVVKLWANGVPRKVVIDDLLPVNSSTGQLLCSCTTQENELWVSLIEKAYLKLNGGYDFPGGNSGIDLFALTGWIPERFVFDDLADDPSKEDRLWEQMKSAFHYGDCIITMTTGEISKEQEKVIGLVPMHVYAVLNVYETSDAGEKLRLLQLKNPWRKMSWRGAFSKFDKRWDSALGAELRAFQAQSYPKMSSSSDEDDGMFWIDIEDVKHYFDSLYLNWNPALFPFRTVWHEHWPVELGPANDSTTLGFNPQYSLTFKRRNGTDLGQAPTSCTVWVLLSRHVREVERNADNTAQQFLTLHVYGGTGGQRVFYNQNALFRGTYSNNPHTLVSLDVDFAKDPEPSFTLVPSQYEKFASLDYTLSVFSTTPFSCRSVPHVETITSFVVDDEWDSLSAGGRPLFSSFMNNPQYHIQVVRPYRDLRLVLDTPTGTPVNLRVVIGAQDRVCGVVGLKSHIRVISSGEYRPGFCMMAIEADELPPASDIVVIPSAFEADVVGKFKLHVLCDPPNALTKPLLLPPEGHGLGMIKLTGCWDSQLGSAAGCASYGCYTFNPKFLVHVLAECEMFVRLLLISTTDGAKKKTLPSLNVSIFESNSEGSLLLSSNPRNAFEGASSGEGTYSGGSPAGVCTPPGVRFPAGWYVVVPSTYDPQEECFELRIFSSSRIQARPLE